MGSGNYDAVLLVSFGGPERRADVIPFLENVTRGRSVPPERLLGSGQTLLRVRRQESDQRFRIASCKRHCVPNSAGEGRELPVYWGNRNWHPLLRDTIRTMAGHGVKRAIAFVTSAFSSYSGCRQYRENIEEARAALGGRAPEIDKIRPFFNHPGFIEAMAHLVRSRLDVADFETGTECRILYTAHSIPTVMAETCNYVDQLSEAARLVSERAGIADWELVFQSRSGPPSQPWLGPDINDRLRALSSQGVKPGLRHADRIPLGPHRGAARSRHRGGRGRERLRSRIHSHAHCGHGSSFRCGRARFDRRAGNPRPLAECHWLNAAVPRRLPG